MFPKEAALETIEVRVVVFCVSVLERCINKYLHQKLQEFISSVDTLISGGDNFDG